MTQLKKQNLRLYRPHRGNFDQWRRYDVTINGSKHLKIADGQVIDLGCVTCTLEVSIGRSLSYMTQVNGLHGQVCVCALAINPKTDTPPIILEMVNEADLQSRLLRFDRPPYFGGRKVGLIFAVASTILVAGLAVMAVGGSILGFSKAIETSDTFGMFFIPLVGTVPCFLFGFVAACGVRGLYYYFQLPKEWQH